METMVHDNPPAVKEPTYYLSRAQLQQALECAIDGHQEYLSQHGLDAAGAIVAGINEVFEGLDADQELHRCDGEPLTLQLAPPDPSATIAELMRQRDQAQAAVKERPALLTELVKRRAERDDARARVATLEAAGQAVWLAWCVGESISETIDALRAPMDGLRQALEGGAR
jgi:hypothetical protein